MSRFSATPINSKSKLCVAIQCDVREGTSTLWRGGKGSKRDRAGRNAEKKSEGQNEKELQHRKDGWQLRRKKLVGLKQSKRDRKEEREDKSKSNPSLQCKKEGRRKRSLG